MNKKLLNIYILIHVVFSMINYLFFLKNLFWRIIHNLYYTDGFNMHYNLGDYSQNDGMIIYTNIKMNGYRYQKYEIS